MRKVPKFTSTLLLILSVVFFVASCVQGAGVRGKSSSTKSSSLSGNGSSPNGPGAIDTGTTNSGSTLFSQKIELSHLVDPFDGTYKKKLTIPKNFKGNLYLAGLNIAALSNRLIKVRFNFGVDKQSVVLNATLARAPGIIPQTDIQVLVIDMNSAPFSKMRLGYDLYDYNQYTKDLVTGLWNQDVVTDPRDGGLYCRGLKSEDDPTFIPLTQDSKCSAATDRCLYSYAKIVDSTLYDDRVVNGVTSPYSSIPSRPQVWSEATGVRSPTTSSFAGTVCLPDDSGVSTVNELFNLSPTLPDLNGTPTLYVVSTLLGLTDLGITPNTNAKYYYYGPYRFIDDTSGWQIYGDAIFNSSAGLFQVQPGNPALKTGYHSLLFPRAGKIPLSQGVSYLGSSDYFGARARTIADSTGTSQYVDGCNIRASNYDPSTNQGIGSCNVDSSIDVFYMQDNQEVSITSDKSIKLQLIRDSLTNYQGKEVLTTSFKRCENSTTCGSNECCFNSRCWSKDLVTQCLDATPIVGNQEIGANCKSDFECSSLCCNQSTGACAPHSNTGTNPIFCSKSPGQQCVTKEFCAQQAVVTCQVVKNGLKPDGTPPCTLRCPAVMTFGDCKGGVCTPPVQPAVPPFDPVTCAGAVDP